MKEYKKSTIKELRNEMAKRDIGYMSNWTKTVLIKRLVEEDKKGKYQPREQLEHYKVMFKSLEVEYEELEEDFKKLSDKQERLLELNNTYARDKATIKERMLAIKANRQFLESQKQTIVDDLNPEW